jgi:hypothetical protein
MRPRVDPRQLIITEPLSVLAAPTAAHSSRGSKKKRFVAPGGHMTEASVEKSVVPDKIRLVLDLSLHLRVRNR